jgi:glycosyltransferase involved in cell wall biosynthesis
VQAPVSRNAPCPCGSGLRYKNCHGAIAVPAPHIDPLKQHLERAMAAQQAGQFADAAAAYEAALALQPASFDALHMLGVVRYQQGDFEQALALLDRALAIDRSVPAARFNRELVQAALDRRPAEAEIAAAAEAFATRMATETGATNTVTEGVPVRVIAFYLPQFHRIAENDEWWGEGFTEWTNVRKAQPNFPGHWQPQLPGELGYYDLTDSGVRRAQAVLARAHGVDAFCYYYYWFGGRRLLERPLADVLASGDPDFPFCVCWANENWTRRWDGRDNEVLMRQRYSPGDAHAFIAELLPLFRDARYVRVNSRPLLLVYKIADIPDVAATVRIWRDACRAAGVGDPYLCAVQRHGGDDPTPFGFDAAVEFPPIGHAAENVTASVAGTGGPFRGAVFRYANLAAHYLTLPRPPFPQHRGVTPMWDNTARRQDDGMIVMGSTPGLFGVWLASVLRQTRLRHDGDERLLFINAWNEWAEGNHLEPDATHGRGYLEALRTARRVEAEPLPTRPPLATIERELGAGIASGAIRETRFGRQRPLGASAAAVVMPLYNHARYLERALASLVAQTRIPDLLVAVDDGSTDGSADIIEAFARSAPFPVTLLRQPNAGADRALNRGIALAGAGIIALLNSDDAFAPTRLARLIGALGDGVDLSFSACEFIGDDDQPADGHYVRRLRERLDEAARAPTLLHALVRYNVAVSTGNLVFRRALLSQTGGFAPLAVCHDWDFLLAASYATRFAFVPEALYRYRLHDSNTFAGRRITGVIEGEIALHQFFARIVTHPWLDARTYPAFVTFARDAGLSGYLSESGNTRA